VSQVPVSGTTRVVALPNLGQSAILGVSAEHGDVVTLTLSYDHALCDGVYAANFLRAVADALESTNA
jgi:pyruvate/2-oxoglutarate dehydrogenase complex dihydrolipoamide acyltransferase (E2) component